MFKPVLVGEHLDPAIEEPAGEAANTSSFKEGGV